MNLQLLGAPLSTKSVDGDETVTRFLDDRRNKHVLKKNQKVSAKPRAFYPHKPSLTLSIQRIHEMAGVEREIWRLADLFLSNPRDHRYRFRGDIVVSSIRSVGLDVVSVPKPNLRHGDVVNWPKAMGSQDSEEARVAREDFVDSLNALVVATKVVDREQEYESM